MKVLFLDVDGVLNYREWFRIHGREDYPLDPVCIELVQRIIKETGCKIVLSSTWRNHEGSVQELKKYFEIIDKTPHFSSFRGDEIKAWLEKHPEVTKYAILDDDNDMHPDQKLFDCSFDIGLTHEMTQEIIDYFNLAGES